ncbi:MAG: TIGR03546 family protein [Nitrospirae bacterium]|nr:TIGR03546 family protein [Nitrospirota bacterium]
MLRATLKFLHVLNSEAEPGQISLALAFALITGFTPLWSLHNLFVLLLVLILRVNLSAFLLGAAVFSGVAYLLDPVFHRLGLAVLTAQPLNGVWTALYNSTLWKVERFNNSVVMGSLLVSLALFAPTVLALNWAIRQYRARVLAWVKRLRIVQALTATKFAQMYRSYSNLGGGG